MAYTPKLSLEYKKFDARYTEFLRDTVSEFFGEVQAFRRMKGVYTEMLERNGLSETRHALKEINKAICAYIPKRERMIAEISKMMKGKFSSFEQRQLSRWHKDLLMLKGAEDNAVKDFNKFTEGLIGEQFINPINEKEMLAKAAPKTKQNEGWGLVPKSGIYSNLSPYQSFLIRCGKRLATCEYLYTEIGNAEVLAEDFEEEFMAAAEADEDGYGPIQTYRFLQDKCSSIISMCYKYKNLMEKIVKDIEALYADPYIDKAKLEEDFAGEPSFYSWRVNWVQSMIDECEAKVKELNEKVDEKGRLK